MGNENGELRAQERRGETKIRPTILPEEEEGKKLEEQTLMILFGEEDSNKCFFKNEPKDIVIGQISLLATCDTLIRCFMVFLNQWVYLGSRIGFIFYKKIIFYFLLS